MNTYAELHVKDYKPLRQGDLVNLVYPRGNVKKLQCLSFKHIGTQVLGFWRPLLSGVPRIGLT